MNNTIHPTAVLDGDVKLGTSNRIGPYTVLIGPLEMGDNNIIGPHVVIGGPGEDTKNPRYDSSQSKIVIGHRNIIREFTAIQKPCYESVTEIGSDVHLMHGVHVPHDAILEDKVVLTPLVVIGGISRLMEGANIGMGATVHQYSVIGQYSIVATGASAVKNVKPFSRHIPGKPISVNHYAIEKYGFSEFKHEIERYVLGNMFPVSEKIANLIRQYELFHTKSKREQY